MAQKNLMVFPFTVAIDGEGKMRDPAQGVYARSLARMLAERLSVGVELQATAATLTADGPLDGEPEGAPQSHGWVVASQPWTLQEACRVRLPDGMEVLLHGAAELTDRVRLRLLVVDQPRSNLALDHVVLRPRGELFAALDEAARAVALALGEVLPEGNWPTSDVEAYVAYLRGRDMSAAHEAGVHVQDPARSFDGYLEAARRDPAFEDARERLLALALDFALGGAGPPDAAREGCERLLLLDPTAFKAHAAIAEIELAQGNPAAARERLEQVLAIDPSFSPAFERLGTALLQLRRYEEALPWLARAIEDNPEDAEALHGLGIACAELGRFDEAAAAFRGALRFGPASAPLHQNLARALDAKGDRAGAREHWQQARLLAGDQNRVLAFFRAAWRALTGKPTDG